MTQNVFGMFWKNCQEKLKRSVILSPKTIKVKNSNQYKAEDIANEFNKFFTNVGPNLAKNIGVVNKKIEDYLTYPDYRLEFKTLSFVEFEKAFKTLKRNKAAGYDNVNINVVIDSYEEIKKILFQIFKVFIEQGIFPDLLKIAKVTPVYKSGDQTNYRPISVLPVFSKILERIIYNRLYNYLTANNLLYDKQFGFQKNNSTEHAILQLVRDIRNSFEKGEFTLGVFIDLSKAFDTVDHEILLRKIMSYGINERMLKLLKNYLLDRKQYIYYNDTSMDLLQVPCGVPQGSILGPLLFLIYVNDLYKASSTLMEVMFADDTNLFISNKNIETLFTDMNTELAKITIWFKANKLSLNVKKTKWILFHSTSKRRSVPSVLPQLEIGNDVIERETVTKFLGVLIDENLIESYWWKSHVLIDENLILGVLIGKNT